MSLVVLLGALTGLGCVGVVRGVRTVPPSLESIAAAMNRPVSTRSRELESDTVPMRAGRAALAWGDRTGLTAHPRWLALRPSLAITNETAEGLAAKTLVCGGAALLAPPLVWLLVRSIGFSLPPAFVLVLAMIAVPTGGLVPVAALVRRARLRRRHFRTVIGSFVDLVVLGLAGGVGVEGALFAASQVSADWAARRMARSLSRARDAGQSPWTALGQLGEEIGVSELVELSSTLELAGTEGARIRQSLSARAVALRRHEQAEAESEANATTERLFLPGALLLMGFMLFIGYPAFSRVVGGL